MMRNLKKAGGPVFDRAFYSPREAAELAGVHSSTIMNYIRSGRLYGVRLSERVYRIPVRSLRKLLAPETVRPPRITIRPFAKVDLKAWERKMAREHRESRSGR
jgi:excisionase family DNA binding protein